MQLEEQIVGEVAVVRVSGEIVLKKNRSMLLHDKVRHLLQQGHANVLIDLGNVTFVDSAGLGELVQTNSTAKDHGAALKLFGPSNRLREMMNVTRLTSILAVYEDETEAFASCRAQQA
jgi:anti-sigma B factor antagonist